MAAERGVTPPDPGTTAEALRQILADLARPGREDADLLLMQLQPKSAGLLERCAIPHLFDEEILRVLAPTLPAEAIDAFLEEIGTLPAIRQVGDCLALHDIVRGQIFARWLAPERRTEFAAISDRLVAHFEIEAIAPEAAESTELALLFHRIGSDPDAGFRALEDTYRSWRETARYGAAAALVRLAGEYRKLLTPDQLAWLSFYEAEVAFDGRDLAGATGRLTEMAAGPLATPLAIRAALLLSNVLRQEGRAAAALPHARRALDLALTPEGGSLLHRVHLELGAIAREQGEVDDAIRELRWAVEAAKAAGDRLALASAYNSLGTLLGRSEPRAAIDSMEAAAALLTKEGDAARRAQLLNNLGIAYGNAGEWDKARGVLEESLAIKRRASELHGLALTLLNLARVFSAKGERIAARNALAEAAKHFEATRDARHAAAARTELARVLLRESGEPDEARREAGNAARLLEAAGRADDARAVQVEFGLERRGWRDSWLYVVLAVLLLPVLLLLLLVALYELT